MAQSTIFPIFLRAEYRNDGQGFARFQSDAQRAANVAKAEFRSVGAVIDEALSRQRNTSKALDLGIDELREAAAAQRARAIAAREVAEATARLAPIQAKEGVSLRVSADATRRYANEQDRLATELEQQIRVQELVQQELNKTASATDLVTAASRRGTTATQNVINSQRASRTAFIQLGQQMQDVAVQAQMGTNAFIIFGQQVPQAAFALSGLANSANRAQAAVGRFATFLSGPFGALIFVAIAALGPLVQRLLESGDAADDASRSQRNLAEVLADTTSSYEEVTQALREYNREQERSREVTLSALGAQAAQIASNLRVAVSIREKIKAELELFQAQVRAGPTGPGGQGQIGALAAATVLAGELAQQDSLIRDLTTSANNTAVEVATEIARVQSDSASKIRLGFEVLREEAKSTITDVNALADRLTQLNRQEKAALEAERKSGRSTRSSDAAARRRAREAQQLATFGEQAAEQIQRINERFDEQTLLVDRAAQSTRQLDRIITELAERKPEGFQELIDQAEEAKRTIEDALVRPFQVLREESENRLAIEEALAQGRVDEAAALQEIFRIQQQIGPLTSEQRDDVRDIVAFEQQRIRYLRDQQVLIEAQMDVVANVRRDLQSILSGRPTDFIKNFRQALLDLQGARLFEDLFGDSFRAIQEELQGNTPQGRANAAYTAEVNKTAQTTATLDDALADLTGAVQRTTAALGVPANDNGASAAALFGGSARGIGAAALMGIPGITVTGNRQRELDLSRVSIADLAERTARGIVEPLTSKLDDVLGPQFAAALGTVLTGALSGFIRGGEAGGVLGGAKGLVDALNKDGTNAFLTGLSEKLGTAVAGAQTGTTVNAISNALGIRGSRTGSQIGGALGSFIPIPGGDIIGAIAGNLLGGLLKGTPRGSAIIGGGAAGLGITGFYGNSSSRKEAATGLAGSVLEAIDRIAEQLGATVNASAGRVSIGVRNDSINVDPQGRGFTKTSKFPDIRAFGDDAEAAIAFAVQDLINDGVITGLRQSEQNLLRAGNDIEAALRDVLTFRSVFDRLEEIRDPLGFAIGQLNREFEGLIDLFERAGASTEEFADLEELYNLERARAIEDATDRVASSLRQLLNDLTIGDSGLSLRSRRANALGQFNDLAARVASGDTSAFDDFADISQQLLDIERQLFGSTQSYFDRLAQITQLTEQAIAEQTNVTSIGSGVPSPFEERAEINRSIDTMNADVTGWLRAINDNLIALNPNAQTPSVASGGGDGRGFNPFPTLIANF